jgi:hypothetical protein
VGSYFTRLGVETTHQEFNFQIPPKSLMSTILMIFVEKLIPNKVITRSLVVLFLRQLKWYLSWGRTSLERRINHIKYRLDGVKLMRSLGTVKSKRIREKTDVCRIMYNFMSYTWDFIYLSEGSRQCIVNWFECFAHEEVTEKSPGHMVLSWKKAILIIVQTSSIGLCNHSYLYRYDLSIRPERLIFMSLYMYRLFT